MPAQKTKKNLSKRSKGFTPSRLVKTNGHYSKGKLVIVVVSFVAIAVIISQLAFASSWSEQFFADSPGIGHQNGSPSGVYYVAGGVAHPIWQSASTNGYMWYGPYDTLYVPQPSGMNYMVCTAAAGINPGLGYNVTYFRFEFSINHGANIIFHQNYQVVKWQPICFTIHLKQGIYSGVEYRIAYVAGAYTNIQQVNIQKMD